jgi:hypothetical protein
MEERSGFAQLLFTLSLLTRPRGRVPPARLVGRTGRNDGVGYAVRTVVSGGSKLLIFAPQAAQSHDLIVLIRRR